MTTPYIANGITNPQSYIPTFQGADLGTDAIKVNTSRDYKEQDQAIKLASQAYDAGNEDLAKKYLVVAVKYDYYNGVSSTGLKCDVVYKESIQGRTSALLKDGHVSSKFNDFVGSLRGSYYTTDADSPINALCHDIKLGFGGEHDIYEPHNEDNCTDGVHNHDHEIPVTDDDTDAVEEVEETDKTDKKDAVDDTEEVKETDKTDKKDAVDEKVKDKDKSTDQPKWKKALKIIGGVIGGIVLLKLLGKLFKKQPQPPAQQQQQILDIPQYYYPEQYMPQIQYVPTYPPMYYEYMPCHSGCMTDMPISNDCNRCCCPSLSQCC